MVSPLGSEATAAFTVPGRLMVIDAIVAFALGPVVSVAISREHRPDNKYIIIKSSLGLALLLSFCLLGIGLLIYLVAVEYLVTDQRTRDLALTGVLCMIISVPIRMLVFISGMCLFACGQGRRVSYIYIAALIVNAALNWLLIYYFGFGFQGAYMATLIVASLEVVGLLWLTARLTGGWPFSRFQRQWLQKIIQQAGAEWGTTCFLAS